MAGLCNTSSHLIQLRRQSLSRVVSIRLETGLSVPGHVHHQQPPALGQVLGHDHPHGLVAAEAMHEEDCLGLLIVRGRGGGGGGEPLKVAVVDVSHLDELAPQSSIQIPTKPGCGKI